MSRSSDKRLRWIGEVVFVLLMAIARDAAGEPTREDLRAARVLFNEGLALRANGELAPALEKFKGANALGGTPITALELGRTYAMVGRLLEGREVLQSVERIAHKPNESERSLVARREAAQLAVDLNARIPTLAVRLENVPIGAALRVSIDGVEVDVPTLGSPRPVDPGRHVVTAHAGEASEVRVEVDVLESRVQSVDVRFPAPPPPMASPQASVVATAPAPPHVDVPPRRGTNGLVWVGVSAVGAGLAVGTIAGIVTLTKASALKSECFNQQCGPSGHGDLVAANTAGTIATIGFAVAGAGVALTVWGLVNPKVERAPAQSAVVPWLGLGSAGVAGRF